MSDSGPLHWMLRLACAAEFIGHGAFGIITKAAWLPYFAVAGISAAWAWTLMPVIGVIDIALSTLALLLRFTTGMLLIGHGGIGAIMAKDWTPYFAVLGVGAATVEARALIPL